MVIKYTYLQEFTKFWIFGMQICTYVYHLATLPAIRKVSDVANLFRKKYLDNFVVDTHYRTDSFTAS
jgi:hypothetical protein